MLSNICGPGNVQAFRRRQPGSLRSGRRTGLGVIPQLSELLLQAFTQLLDRPEQAFAGASLKKQSAAATRNTYLAAVLVTPGCQPLQGLLFSCLVPLWRGPVRRPSASAVLAPAVQVLPQLREADGQPAGCGCCVL